MSKQVRTTGRGIVMHQGKVLLMERCRDGLHYYSIPGGEVEAGETIEQAALRELYEEMSIHVTLLRKVYIMQSEGSEHHIYLCDYDGGVPRLHPDSPEARSNAFMENVFKPVWIDIHEVASKPFLYWEPLRVQMSHDLQQGFSDECKTIVVTD